jgi:hypothetical protein
VNDHERNRSHTRLRSSVTPRGGVEGGRRIPGLLRLLPQLLGTHAGKYVAIHNGQVVDSDSDEVALILRVQAKIGYVPIHVGLVSAAQPVVRIPYYRNLTPLRIG